MKSRLRCVLVREDIRGEVDDALNAAILNQFAFFASGRAKGDVSRKYIQEEHFPFISYRRFWSRVQDLCDAGHLTTEPGQRNPHRFSTSVLPLNSEDKVRVIPVWEYLIKLAGSFEKALLLQQVLFRTREIDDHKARNLKWLSPIGSKVKFARSLNRDSLLRLSETGGRAKTVEKYLSEFEQREWVLVPDEAPSYRARANFRRVHNDLLLLHEEGAIKACPALKALGINRPASGDSRQAISLDDPVDAIHFFTRYRIERLMGEDALAFIDEAPPTGEDTRKKVRQTINDLGGIEFAKEYVEKVLFLIRERGGVAWWRGVLRRNDYNNLLLWNDGLAFHFTGAIPGEYSKFAVAGTNDASRLATEDDHRQSVDSQDNPALAEERRDDGRKSFVYGQFRVPHTRVRLSSGLLKRGRIGVASQRNGLQHVV